MRIVYLFVKIRTKYLFTLLLWAAHKGQFHVLTVANLLVAPDVHASSVACAHDIFHNIRTVAFQFYGGMQRIFLQKKDYLYSYLFAFYMY